MFTTFLSYFFSIVLLDEIDHLVTREQDVLYQLFQWASSRYSRLILIGTTRKPPKRGGGGEKKEGRGWRMCASSETCFVLEFGDSYLFYLRSHVGI